MLNSITQEKCKIEHMISAQKSCVGNFKFGDKTVFQNQQVIKMVKNVICECYMHSTNITQKMQLASCTLVSLICI